MTEPARFRKRPVVIEAMRWTGRNWVEMATWIGLTEHPSLRVLGGQVLVIPTLEGEMSAQLGDWVIRGVAGEFYPCKPGIFARTYEAVGGAD